MATREEMIKEVVDDYNAAHEPHAHDSRELEMRMNLYADVKEIKDLLKKLVEKQG